MRCQGDNITQILVMRLRNDYFRHGPVGFHIQVRPRLGSATSAPILVG